MPKAKFKNLRERSRISIRIKAVRDAYSAAQIGHAQQFFQDHYCLLVCAMLERSFETALVDFALSCGGQRLSRHVESTFAKGLSPTSRAMKGILERYDPNWLAAFSLFLEENTAKGIRSELVDRVVEARNRIAHGGIGAIIVHDIDDSLVEIEKVCDWLEKHVLNSGR